MPFTSLIYWHPGLKKLLQVTSGWAREYDWRNKSVSKAESHSPFWKRREVGGGRGRKRERGRRQQEKSEAGELI